MNEGLNTNLDGFEIITENIKEIEKKEFFQMLLGVEKNDQRELKKHKNNDGVISYG